MITGVLSAKGSKQNLLNTSVFVAHVINVTNVSWMVSDSRVTFPPKMTPQQYEMEKYEAMSSRVV